MKEDPPLDAKCRDKFLVQSVLTKADPATNATNVWSTLETSAKSSIQERKIRVNFLPSDDAGATVNGISFHPDEEPPAYSSPSPQFGSPAAIASLVSKSTAESKPTLAGSRNTSSAAGSALAAVANTVPTSTEDLQQQLVAAKTQIAKLTSQLNDPQLRQRKIQEGSEKIQTAVQQSNEMGVPLRIVAGLCLLSFLIAYLFF